MVLARALKLLRKQQRQSLRESECDSSSEIESPVFESPEDNAFQNVDVQRACNYGETEMTTNSSFSFSDMSDEDDGEERVRALKLILTERGLMDDEPASSQPETQTKLQADTDSLPSLSEDDIDESSRANALKYLLQDREDFVWRVKKETKYLRKQKAKAGKRHRKMMRLKELKAMEKKKAKPSSKFSLQRAKSPLVSVLAGAFFCTSVPNSIP